MKLLIVIPALNEEASMASIIERCLAASADIINQTIITAVDITVVSDGSTDRTVEIAKSYEPRISLIIFEKNRGYGAAISEGWSRSDADLLSFLDADGTCDPNYFIPMANDLVEKNADVVLGCRLNKNSRMPLIRRVGNTMFAWMLSAFSLTHVKDTASGMRIVRRTSLIKLMPLPQGLHFTPAMSARAIMSRDLTITEVDMTYNEREGESKLNPIKDGIRFLRVILETAMLYRPSRPMGFFALILLSISMFLIVFPVLFWLRESRLEEWMIYRFLVSELLFTLSVMIVCVTYLGRKAVDISLADEPLKNKNHGVLGWFFGRRWFWIVPALLLVIGSGFVWKGFVQLVTTGHVTEHWSHFIAMMTCFTVASIFSVCKVVDYSMNMLADRLGYLKTMVDTSPKTKTEVLLP